ncbi:MAG: hypothetical protein ACLGJB_09900 [Blastocatellia bacterium]
MMTPASQVNPVNDESLKYASTARSFGCATRSLWNELIRPLSLHTVALAGVFCARAREASPGYLALTLLVNS